MDQWQEATFTLATEEGDLAVTGFTYAGLGMHRVVDDEPDYEIGNDDEVWTVTHLASGRWVGEIWTDNETVFVIATALAQATDWSAFTAKDDWKDTAPDLLWKLGDIWLQYQNELQVSCLPWSYVTPAEVEAMGAARSTH